MRRLPPVCVFGFFSIAVAGAGEPSSGDSIAAAKRELELIKAANQGTAAPTGSMPKVPTPELNMGATEAGTWLQRERARAKEEVENQKRGKSANWLVDAMMEKPEGTGGRQGGDDAGVATGDLSVEGSPLESFFAAEMEAGQAAAPTKMETNREANREDERNPTEPVYNPLAAFLGDWMSAQDFALLGSNLQKSADGEIVTGTGAVPSPVTEAFSSGNTATSLEGMMEGTGIANRTFGPPSARENPYLQSFDEPGFATAVVAPPQTAPAPLFFPPPAAPEPAPPPPAPASRIPDFVKPQADQKYFKQLKRF